MSNPRGFTLIKLGGKKRPFKWGTNSTHLYCEKRGITIKYMQKELAENMQKGEITGGEIRDMMWAGLYAGCRTEKVEIDFDEFDVGDWLDEDAALDQEDMATTKAFKAIIQYVKDDATSTKKKTTPKVKTGT